MLWSLALVFLGGLLAGEVFRRLRLPPLLGMLLVGIAFGPYALGLLDDSLLAISADLRKVALIIILTRAGLSLDIGDLRKVGRSAVLLCFVPATFELVGTVILAPRLLGVSVLEAAIIGSVIAAVSPAVVVPRMLRLMDEGYGAKQGIPQMILAGASVDDVYVIVLFSSFTSLASGGTLSPLDFVRIPTSLVLGIAAGVLCGLALVWWFSRVHMRDSIKVVVFLALSFVLVTIEDHCTGIIGFSGLLAVMSMGIMLGQRIPVVSKRLSAKYDRLWVGAELLLFVLVGAMVNVAYAAYAGVAAILLILGQWCSAWQACWPACSVPNSMARSVHSVCWRIRLRQPCRLRSAVCRWQWDLLVVRRC